MSSEINAKLKKRSGPEELSESNTLPTTPGYEKANPPIRVNARPVVFGVSVLPEMPQVGDDISVRFEVNDPDQDQIKSTEYKTNRNDQWTFTTNNQIELSNQSEGILVISIRATDSRGQRSEVKIVAIPVEPSPWTSTFIDTTVKAHRLAVADVAISSDGQSMATAGEEGAVKLWSRQSSVIWEIETRAQSVAFEPNGSHLATGGSDHKLHLWRLRDGDAVAELAGSNDWINSIAFSTAGTEIIAGTEDGQAFLWEWPSRDRLDLPKIQFNRVYSVAFNPRGQSVAIGGSAATGEGLLAIAKYNPGIGTTERRADVQAESKLIRSIAFSQDGRWIATGGWDGTVRIRDTTDGTVRRSLGPIAATKINRVQFTADNRALVVASANEKVRIWNTNNWREINTNLVAPATITSLAVDPQGTGLIVGCSNGHVRIWRTRK